MVFLVPLPTGVSNYRQEVALDGVPFVMTLLWNARASRWFMSLETPAGERLVTGRKVCSAMPWAGHETVEGIPAGQLWVITVESDDSDPGLRDLGERVMLVYADAVAAG